jgi:putative ATPase
MTRIPEAYRPLADRMRPRSLAAFTGQDHILGEGKPLRRAIEEGNLHSMVLWGPPGTGKTTLAKLLAEKTNAEFLTLSAVLAGVKEIRNAVATARQIHASESRQTILFIDEAHRFNKAQQDAFLPYERLEPAALRAIIDAALEDSPQGLGERHLVMPGTLRDRLAQAADGDARRALNLLEIAADLAEETDGASVIPEAVLNEVIAGGTRRFDKGGDDFYDQISALHKSVRGSSPDGALYWLVRMLDGGCDPLYIARRVVRMASEDIGNADPRDLTLCLSAWDVQERLGSPEGELALAQAVMYLACAAKSNAVYTAYNSARSHVRETGSLEVPVHLRNAPTKLMKELGYGRAYRYAHDEPEAYAAGEHYFPDGMAAPGYYQPVPRGLEIRIAEKLAHLRELDRKHRG